MFVLRCTQWSLLESEIIVIEIDHQKAVQSLLFQIALEDGGGKKWPSCTGKFCQTPEENHTIFNIIYMLNQIPT